VASEGVEVNIIDDVAWCGLEIWWGKCIDPSLTQMLLLLLGGDKSSREKDIARARECTS